MAEHALQEMPAPADEQERRRALRNHKAFVTGLLILAAVIFLGCSWWQSQGTAPGWVGYVRAAAEAGMVGGLADWFAVTALFRHPMGLPIPHTALIPKKKDQLGSALSEFCGHELPQRAHYYGEGGARGDSAEGGAVVGGAGECGDRVA